MEDELRQDKQADIRNPDGTFKPGVSGNPLGRPKGKTLKEFAREFYMLKSDEEKRAYIERVEEKRPGFSWEMAEGKADTKTDLTSDGKAIQVIVPAAVAQSFKLAGTNPETDGEHTQ